MEYLFIPLDVFHKKLHNKGIKIDSREQAWLAFLSEDSPEVIVKLIDSYPEFRGMYHDIYQLCRNMERIMGIFSEKLKILDRNTVQLMIDKLQDQVDELRGETEFLRSHAEEEKKRAAKERLKRESSDRELLKEREYRKRMEEEIRQLRCQMHMSENKEK